MRLRENRRSELLQRARGACAAALSLGLKRGETMGERERYFFPVPVASSFFSRPRCSLALALSFPFFLSLHLFLLTFPSFPTAPWRSLVAAATTPEASAPLRAAAAAARIPFAFSLVVAVVIAPAAHFSCASSSTLSAPSMACAVTVEVVFCFLTTRVASSSAAVSRELDMGFEFFFPFRRVSSKERKKVKPSFSLCLYSSLPSLSPQSIPPSLSLAF